MKTWTCFTATGLWITLAFIGVPYAPGEEAVETIGKISRVRGEVSLISGTKIEAVEKEGVAIRTGDHVQTKDGEADILLNDGAIIKISPFTNGQVVERQEKSGAFTLKTVPVRRVTCTVGKMWVKSGNSERKTYLQTPTSVCALRGTEVAFGYVPTEKANK